MTEFEKTYQNYNPRSAALSEARALLTAAAKAAMADGTLPEAELPAFIVEIPADTKNGDIASNLAMAGARTWRKAPKMIADALIAHLPSIEGSVFAKVEVAGPGFINLFLAPAFWASVVLGAAANKDYGRTDYGKGAKYNVEFVSANPTGPMHMGNARGGALGDCLAAVLDWSGYDVTREFYINDAGNQIQKFGKSLAVRYLQKFCGEEAYPLPAECYQGGDIKVLAGEFADLHGDCYVAACQGMDEETLFASEAFETLKNALVDYALPKNIAALKRDLGKYRIDYDVWFHESTLHESGAVKAVVEKNPWAAIGVIPIGKQVAKSIIIIEKRTGVCFDMVRFIMLYNFLCCPNRHLILQGKSFSKYSQVYYLVCLYRLWIHRIRYFRL